MSGGAPKRHHYVPQFYLRRFARADDPNKVAVIERHRDVLVADIKSIGGIGYEEGLHDFHEGRARASIEGALNKTVETPFSQSPTWQKISNGGCANLDAADRLPLYGFARHLQLRNLETLRFIEAENARFRRGELDGQLSDDEQDMHSWIAASADGGHALFREGALATLLPPDAGAINVMVCRSPIALRTSTNPAVRVSYPGQGSVYGGFFDPFRTWWLALDREWGALIVAGGPSGFSINEMPDDAARVMNRQYLVQLLHGGSARYLLAEDDYIAEDLEWADFVFDRQTTRGFRYRARSALR